ncbi:RrF2 family transcriptional regulator [Paenibacillus sepulcri]|uniref:Rrf2 family transcriptional regulator n=1 Tax=Paenibacillus sepulcri TaxID=359917 RepID=A0ABS7C0U3_9BACL|nr:Rrf2 family transcriptional regulator [Paenibacillus sepulcri]
MQLLIQSGELGPTWFHVALRALVLLSRTDKLLKSQNIANELGAEPSYVRKILAALSKAEIVSAHGGREGGYALAKSPREITVGEVYRVLGKSQSTPYWSVPSTGTEQFISLLIDKAEQQFQSTLDVYSIEEIDRQGALFKTFQK